MAISFLSKFHGSLYDTVTDMKLFLLCLAIVGLSWAKSSNKTSQNSLLGLSCNCGWRNSGRIVGGKETKVNEYPWMVSLSNGCGGSIITSWHVLTAAHCTDGRSPRSIKVNVGQHYHIGDKGSSLKTHSVAKILVHDRYNSFEKTNDVSILYLANEISFTSQVGPICLPTSKVDLVGKYLKVMGWGLTMGTGSDNPLREVDVKVISNSECKEYWPEVTTSSTKLCAYEKGKDSCYGDSGGPLVYLDPETNRYTQAALVSYGPTDCGKTTDPSVNTDVSAFVDWIKKAVSSTKPGSLVCQKFRMSRSAILFKSG